jgi:hypothetical protein
MFGGKEACGIFCGFALLVYALAVSGWTRRKTADGAFLLILLRNRISPAQERSYFPPFNASTAEYRREPSWFLMELSLCVKFEWWIFFCNVCFFFSSPGTICEALDSDCVKKKFRRRSGEGRRILTFGRHCQFRRHPAIPSRYRAIQLLLQCVGSPSCSDCNICRLCRFILHGRHTLQSELVSNLGPQPLRP